MKNIRWLLLLLTLFVSSLSFKTVEAASNSIPSEGCSYELYWTNPQNGILIDNIQVALKTTYKANLDFKGTCSSFSTRLRATSPSGKEIINTCFDVTTNNNEFSGSVYFDTPGSYVVKASVYFSSDCSRGDQNKDAQITAFAQETVVVISGESASVTDKTATITWKTDKPAEATVWLRQKNDPSKGSKPPGTTSGKMVFNNLSPSTDYIYTVYATTDGWKTEANKAVGADHYFKTNAPGVTTPTNSSNVAPNNTGSTGGNVNVPNINVSNVDYDREAGPPLVNLIGSKSVPELIAWLIKGFLLVIMITTVIIILYGGFRMAMSQGNSETLTAAKRTVTWAIVGLIVSLLSYSIVAILQNLIGFK